MGVYFKLTIRLSDYRGFYLSADYAQAKDMAAAKMEQYIESAGS